MSKLTITLPDHIVRFAEHEAAAQHLSVDDFVSALLETLRGHAEAMPLPVNVSPEMLKQYLDLVAEEVAAGKISHKSAHDIVAGERARISGQSCD